MSEPSAEKDAAEVAALAQVIRPWTVCDDGGGFDHGSERAARAILDSDWFAARVEAAKVEALRDAADSLEGRKGLPGTPRDLWEFRQWLRDRAAALGVEGKS